MSVGCNTLLLPVARYPTRIHSRPDRLAMPDLSVRPSLRNTPTRPRLIPGLAAAVIPRYRPDVADQYCTCDSLPHPCMRRNDANGEVSRMRGNARLDND